MNRSSMSKFTVPDELRELLLDFTISYLLEQPSDIVEYAVDFFTKLRDNRTYNKTAITQSSDESMGSGEDEEFEPPAVLPNRRKSVFAEAYNPEEDDDEDVQKVVHPKSDEQRKRLAEAVKNILLFRALEVEQMQEVLDAMFERRVTSGEYVIKQGDDGDNFYVIESGIYSIFVSMEEGKSPRKVGAYDNCGSFGELALMYNMPRAATIQADTEGLLWAMDRQTFRRIVLKSAFRKRKMYEQLIDGVPMLKALESYERMNLADALVPRTYEDGQEVIHQGHVADGMYFVEEGTIRISMMGDNGVQAEVSRVTKGQYFGELALVTHRPRAASAYAVGHVKLAFLDVEAFERLLGPCMEIMKRNIDDYEGQLERIFGTKISVSEMR